MCMCCPPIYSRRLACEHASRGHTGGRSRRITQPAGLALVLLQEGFSRSFCPSTVKSDVVNERMNRSPLAKLCPMQVALMVVNKFTHISRAGPTVCVCFFSSHSFWTSSLLDVPAGVTQEGRSHRISHPPSFCGACLNFSREKDAAIPFPRRP